MAVDTPEILTADEVCKMFRISKEKLYQDARKGVIPARKFGNQWRFVLSELMEWFEGL